MPEEKEQRVKSINSVKQKKVIMKKSNLNLAATVMICGAFLFSSCIGSFGLHSKLVNWNQSIGTKFCLSGLQHYPRISCLLSGRCVGNQLH